MAPSFVAINIKFYPYRGEMVKKVEISINIIHRRCNMLRCHLAVWRRLLLKNALLAAAIAMIVLPLLGGEADAAETVPSFNGKLVLTGVPESIDGGTIIPVYIQTKDLDNRSTTADKDLYIGLAGEGAFFADSLGRESVYGTVIPAGGDSALVYYMVSPGENIISARVMNDDLWCGAMAGLNLTEDTVLISQMPGESLPNAFVPVEIHVLMGSVLLEVSPGTVSGTGVFYDSSGSVATSVRIGGRSGFALVFYRPSSAGEHVLEFTASDGTQDYNYLTVQDIMGTLNFVDPPGFAPKNQIIPLAIQTRSIDGQPLAVQTDTSIDLIGDGCFYADAQGGSEIYDTIIPAGASQVVVYYLGVEGVNTIEAVSDEWMDTSFNLNVVNFAVELYCPANNAVTYDECVEVSGRTFAGASLKVNGKVVSVDAGGYFKTQVDLAEGLNTVKVVVKYGGSTKTITRSVTRRTFLLNITEPAGNDTVVATPVLTLTGNTLPGTAVSVNGTPVTVTADGDFTGEVPLANGLNTINIEASYEGKSKSVQRNVTRLWAELTEPAADSTTVLDKFTVKGGALPGAALKLNGVAAAPAADGSFTKQINLSPGTNTIMLEASYQGKTVNVTRTVTRLEPDISIVSGDGQAGQPGRTLAEPLKVRVADSAGNPVSGATVDFTVIEGGGSVGAGPLQAGSGAVSVVTGQNGMASAYFTLGSASGNNEVKAGVAGGVKSVTFSAATRRLAASINAVKGGGQKGVAGSELPVAFGFKVLDLNMLSLPGYTVRFSATQGGGLLSSASAVTDSQGIAYVRLTLGSTPGTNEVTALARGEAADGSEVDLAGTAAAVALPRDLRAARVSPESQEFDAGAAAVTLDARLEDGGGNPVEDAQVFWRVIEGEGSLLLNKGLSGASGAVRNVLKPRTESVKVMVWPAGLEDRGVAFTVRATGYELKGQVVNPAAGLPLVVSATGNGKVVVADVASGGAFNLKLASGEWRIKLDYGAGSGSSAGFLLPPAKIVNIPQQGTVEFRLIEFVQEVSGVVVDETGAPVAGAKITLENPLNEFGGSRASADEAGSFTIKVGAGAYVLKCLAEGYQSTSARSLQINSGKVTLDGVLVTELHIVVKRLPAFIEGSVFYQGSPVAGASVFAYGQDRQVWKATTDSSGEYRITVKPGLYTVSGWDGVLGELVLSLDNVPPFDKNPITVGTAGASGVSLSAPLDCGTITGTVTQGGQALAGSRILAVNSATGACLSAATGVDGRYELQAPAGGGTYRVELWDDVGVCAVSTAAVDAGQTVQLDFPLAAAKTVTGKVQVKQGETFLPVSDAVVMAVGSQGGRRAAARVNTTDGGYSLRLMPGSYRFEVSSPVRGNLPGGSQEINSDTALDFTYQELPGVITGKVQTEQGAGLAQVFVSAVGKKGTAVGAYTAEDGAFSLTLEAGEYVVSGSRPDLTQVWGEGKALTANVAPGQDVQVSVIMKEAEAVLSGSVTDEEDNPIAGASVWAENADGGYVSVSTDAGGMYGMSLTKGRWFLGVAADGYIVKKALNEKGDIADRSLVVMIKDDSETKNIAFSANDQIVLSPPKVFTVDALAGGLIENTGAGVQMNLPPSALPAGGQVTIVIKEVSNIPETRTHQPINGRGVAIDVTGEEGQLVQMLRDTIEIRVNYTEEDIEALKNRLRMQGFDDSDFEETSLRLSYYNPETRSWLILPAVQDTGDSGSGGGYFLAKTDHLTEFTVVWPQTSYLQGYKAPVVPSSGGGGGGTAAGAGQSSVVLQPGGGASLSSSDGDVKLDLPAGSVDREVKIGLELPGPDSEAARIAGNMPEFAAGVLKIAGVYTKDARGDIYPSLAVPYTISIKAGSGFQDVGAFYPDPVYQTMVPLKSSYDPATGYVTASASRPLTICAVIETAGTFADLPPDHWAAGYVAVLAGKSILRGVGGGKFEPERPVTRAEVAKMVDLAAAVPGLNSDSTFSDVGGAEWSKPFVVSASGAGILKGYSDGTFRPAQPVTRAELAAVLVRAAGIGTGAAPALTAPDVPAGHWGAAYLAAAVDKGIMGGYPDGGLRPDSPVTRSEAAKMIAKAFGFAK
ncbi:MAG: Cellulosome-anchoring protein precursor [Pelotomaculum sp. PtaU1.Bin035]|nr:MAG: Cellulosome-anchoring protein precursor [Pelotomaculum sp. PtaU1.Bin035]